MFEPRYRQIHIGSDDHLKWQFSVTLGHIPDGRPKSPKNIDK